MKNADITYVNVSSLQPSQFYIDEDRLNNLRNNFQEELFEPIPIKKIDGYLVMTDGHTRVCYLIEKGIYNVPTIIEKDNLDWEAYKINVLDARKRGVKSALDLINNIISKEEFIIKWDRYCDGIQDKLSNIRKFN